MTDRLLRSFLGLDRRTQRLLDELGTWTPEQLQFRSSSGSWSALDLIDHLALTEQAVLASLRSNLSAAHKVTLRDRYRSALVLGIMALPVRVKVPRSVEYLLSLTNRAVLLIGAFFGLSISGAVLTLLWFGVAGVLHPNATGTDWMLVFWPSSVMLVGGWRSTIPGMMIAVSAIAINCILYMAIAYALWQLARLLRTLWA